MIERETLEEIRIRNPIDEVISGYVSLKRAGSNYVGLCPFHSEKSPSFTVFSGSDSFYCFGCGAGGDVISFIRRMENLDYPSAVEFLAKRAGITIVRNSEEKRDAMRRERTLAMNREVARYFHHVLLNTPEGKPGLDYLLSRKLTIPMIRHFGLGFAPDDFGTIPKLLSSKGYTDAEMSSAYLARISEKSGRPYGMFRNRVMFPIIATTGDVVAFGGRVMDDSKPKYLNTSDTPAFKKSRHLFALNFAKDAGASQMILCEGYMDVIALHSAGFTNAVATLGTAITSEQARIFARYTKSVLICYDADTAGQTAASKAFRLLAEAGVDCKLLKVKNAKDPDEYIRKYGGTAFKKLMEGSRSEFDFRYDQIMSNFDLSESEGKFKALDAAVSLISETPSAARRDLLIARISEDFSVTADAVKRDVERVIAKRNYQKKNEERTHFMQESAGIGDRVNPDFAKNPRASASEEAVLGILMLHPEYIEEMKKKNVLPSVDDFASAFGKKVYTQMLNLSDGMPFEPMALGENMTVDEVNRVTRLRLEREKLTDNTLDLLLGCVQRMRDAVRMPQLSLDEILLQKRKKKEN